MLIRRFGVLAGFFILVACGSTPTANTQGTTSPAVSSSPAAVSAAPSPSPSASPSPSPSPAASPSPSPMVTGSIDLGTCPAYAAGQHPLGPIGAPGQGVHADPSLEWQGCGTITVPRGTSRFMTADNWEIGFSATCPNEANYGAGGMGPNVTFTELLIDGSAGPDTAGGAGPWTDSAGSTMAHGGNFQLRVTSIDPRCRWHLAVYPS